MTQNRSRLASGILRLSVIHKEGAIKSCHLMSNPEGKKNGKVKPEPSKEEKPEKEEEIWKRAEEIKGKF